MMKTIVTIGGWMSMLLLLGAGSGRAEEPDDSRILAQVLETRDAILKRVSATNDPASVVFLAFWDFDGTTMKGDCSEGLYEGGKMVFPGLEKLSIEQGLSKVYPPAGGFDRFWNDYTNMDTRIGHWLAYPFIAQMLRGARADDVLNLSRREFGNTMSNYLRASSVKIIRALERGGVESHIISASPDLFVKGAAGSLSIPADHIHGIQVRIRDGQVTEELIYPVTWNSGKREMVKQIVAQLAGGTPAKRVFVLAGFGDSYDTDGPFLKYIATQSLPAGKPIAVFYDNSDAPAEYRGLFYQARHSATLKDQLLLNEAHTQPPLHPEQTPSLSTVEPQGVFHHQHP